MAEVIAFEVDHFRTLQTSVTLTLDRVMRHTFVTHRPLPTRQISLKSEKLWTYGRQTDIESGFIRLA